MLPCAWWELHFAFPVDGVTGSGPTWDVVFGDPLCVGEGCHGPQEEKAELTS